jgi:predicted small secreted protein
MKFLCSCAILAALALTSCNTMIGLGRDTKQGFNWSKAKIQEKRAQSQQSNQQDGYQDQYGAPVY